MVYLNKQNYINKHIINIRYAIIIWEKGGFMLHALKLYGDNFDRIESSIKEKQIKEVYK